MVARLDPVEVERVAEEQLPAEDAPLALRRDRLGLLRQPGPLGPDEIKLSARLEIAGQTSTPAVITRATQRITLRIRILACDGRTVRGALVYATPTPYQQFRGPERPTDANGWATITLTRQRFFPATPQQQNLIVFVRARNPAEDLLGGGSRTSPGEDASGASSLT